MKWVILFAFLLIPTVSAQIVATDPIMNVFGECREYNVTITYYSSKCYDVKIDTKNLNGENMEILTPQGWKSTFFYITDGFCADEKHSQSYKIRTDNSPVIKFQGKLRLDETIIFTSENEITQNCPEPTYPDNRAFWLISAIVILIILAVIVIYVRVLK